jgi:hypothetical protein
MSRFYLIFFFIGSTFPGFSQMFVELPIVSGMPVSSRPTAEFADMDNDGLVDLVITGNSQTSILYNDNLAFTRIEQVSEFSGTTSLDRRPLDIGDFNGDGYLDILQTGGLDGKLFYIHLREVDSFVTLKSDRTGYSNVSSLWILTMMVTLTYLIQEQVVPLTVFFLFA